MRPSKLVLPALAAALALSSPELRADEPAADVAAPAPPPKPARDGLAVLAVGDSARAAWPLAQAIYAKSSLRPAIVDEAHARVLAGEAPAAGAAKDLADLAETRAAIRGDDAPSRQLLLSIATTFRLRGIVVVMTSSSGADARVFLPDTGAFDAAHYSATTGNTGALDWSQPAASLERAYGEPKVAAAPAATKELPSASAERKKDDASSTSRPFYTSPWFWGAIGAAALGGTALYFATRDSSPGPIHLSLQVPK